MAVVNQNIMSVKYPVMEHFYTLQGEGRYTGQAAYFIRLGGCDVGCVWCDVKESWDEQAHPLISVEALIREASKHPARIVVITGGEPTLHDLLPLTVAFKAAGFRTHMETAATNPVTGMWDWITLSPKKFKAPLKENLALANELKVVVFHASDLKWSESFLPFVSESCQLFLQPEWSRHDRMVNLIIEYIEQHPEWSLSLQTHKFVHIR